jgi:hypothetical protein
VRTVVRAANAAPPDELHMTNPTTMRRATDREGHA